MFDTIRRCSETKQVKTRKDLMIIIHFVIDVIVVIIEVVESHKDTCLVMMYL